MDTSLSEVKVEMWMMLLESSDALIDLQILHDFIHQLFAYLETVSIQ